MLNSHLRSRTWRRWLAILATPLLLLSDPATAATGVSPPCLQGTFIQLVDANRDWTRAQWEALFAHLHTLHISAVILQWSVADDQAFYSTKSFKTGQVPVVEWILGLAEDYRMEVMVGLAHQSNHWTEVAKADMREQYLAKELERAALVAGQLTPIVSNYRAFKGWYISEEVDDINWTTDDGYKSLRSYLFQITTLLKTLTPQARIGISAFANAKTPPETVGVFWNGMLQKVKLLDIVYFQDGVGVHKLQLDGLPAYYDALQKATSKHQREMQPVIELFEQTRGMPISEGTFAAVPAPTERIVRQIAVASQFSAKHTSFSIPEYLSPAGGPAAEAAFKAYQELLARSNATCE